VWFAILNPVPVMVTTVPTGPDVGLMLVIARFVSGAGVLVSNLVGP